MSSRAAGAVQVDVRGESGRGRDIFVNISGVILDFPDADQARPNSEPCTAAGRGPLKIE